VEKRPGDDPGRGEEGSVLNDMNSNLVLVGFLVMLVCQDIVAMKAFKNQKTKEGILSALLPGYLLIYGSREESRQVKPLAGWLIGLVILLMGIMR
jgi:hypothetical protein